MNNNVVISLALIFVFSVLFATFTTGQQFETWCGDSDSIDGEPEPSHGLNYFQKGETAPFSAVSNQPTSEPKTDSCIDDNTLSEWYCAGPGANTITNAQYDCPDNYACSDGSCVYSPQSNIQTDGGVIVVGDPDPASVCKDSDKGLDIYTKGQAIDNFKTLEDFCLNSTTLREAICLQQPNQPMIGDTVDIICQSSCLSGFGICQPSGGIIIQQPIPSGNTNCPLACPTYVTLPEKKAALATCDIDSSKPSRILGDFFKKDDSDQLPPPTECTDHIDNDGDGWIDYKEDLGCENAADNNETGPIDLYEYLKAYSENFTNRLRGSSDKASLIQTSLFSENDKSRLSELTKEIEEKQEFIDSVRERLGEGANIDNLREIIKLSDPFASLIPVRESTIQNRVAQETPNRQFTGQNTETSPITGLIGGLETPELEISSTIIDLGYKELFENINGNFERLVRGLQVSRINQCSGKISSSFSHLREILTYYPCTANTYGPITKELVKKTEEDVSHLSDIFNLLEDINLQNELLIIKLQDPTGQKQLDETKKILQDPNAALQENIGKLQKLGAGFKEDLLGYRPVLSPSTNSETTAQAQEAIDNMNRINDIIKNYPHNTETILGQAEQLTEEVRNTGSTQIRNYILGLESRLIFTIDDIQRNLEDLKSKINFMQNSCSDPGKLQSFKIEKDEALKFISDSKADLEAARKSYINIKNSREELEKSGYGEETLKDWINLGFGSADEVIIGFIHVENAILKDASAIQNAIDMVQLNVECIDCQPQVIDKQYIGASGFCETCARDPNQIEEKDLPEILLTDEEKELKKLTNDLNNADTQEELEKAKEAYEKWINENLQEGKQDDGPRQPALEKLKDFVKERGAYIDYKDKLNKTIELAKAGNATEAAALIPEIQKALDRLEGEYKESLEDNWEEIKVFLEDAIRRGKIQEDIKGLVYIESDEEFESAWQKVSASLTEINATEEQIRTFKIEIDAKRSYRIAELEQRQRLVGLEANFSAAITQGDFESTFKILSQIIRLGFTSSIEATTDQIVEYVSLITESTDEPEHISAASRLLAQIGKTNEAKVLVEKLIGTEKSNALIFISQFVSIPERVLIYLQIIPDLESSQEIDDKISLALIKAQLGGEQNIDESIEILVKAKADIQNSEISTERKVLLDARITNILDQIRISLGHGIDFKSEIVSNAESLYTSDIDVKETEAKYSRGEISIEDYTKVLLDFYKDRENYRTNKVTYSVKYELSDIQLLSSLRNRLAALLETLPEGDAKTRIENLVNEMKSRILSAIDIEIAATKDREKAFAKDTPEGRSRIETVSLKVSQMQEIWNNIVTENMEDNESYIVISSFEQGLLVKKYNIQNEIEDLEQQVIDEKAKATSSFDLYHLIGGREVQDLEKIKKMENRIKQLYAYLYIMNSQLSAIELFKARSSETNIEDLESEYRTVRFQLYAEADDSKTSRPLPFSQWGVAPKLDSEEVVLDSLSIYPEAESNVRELISSYNELRNRERILFVQLKMRQHNISESDALVLWWESQEGRFVEGVAEAEAAIQEITDKPYLLRTFAYSTEGFKTKISRLERDRIEVFGDILRNLHKIKDPIVLARAMTIVQTIRQSIRTGALDERFGSFWTAGLAEYTWQADDIEAAQESTDKSIRLSRALKSIAVSGIEPTEFINHLQATSPDYYSILQEAGMIGEGNTLIIPNNPPEWLVSFGTENIPDKHWMDSILNPKQIAITIPTIIIPGAGAGRVAGFIGTTARAASIGTFTARTLAFGTEVLAFHVLSNIGRLTIGEETDFFSASGLAHTALVLGGIKIGKYAGELPFHGTKGLIGRAGSITFSNAGEVGALTAVTYTEDTERSILQRIGESVVLVAQLRIAGLPTKYFDLRPADQRQIEQINGRYVEIETELKGLVTERGIRLRDLELVEARRREMSILNQRMIGIYRSNGLLEALTIAEPTIDAMADKSVQLVLGERNLDITRLLVEAKSRGLKTPEEIAEILVRSGATETEAAAIAEIFINVNFVVAEQELRIDFSEYSFAHDVFLALNGYATNPIFTPTDFFEALNKIRIELPEDLQSLILIIENSPEITNKPREITMTFREFYAGFLSREFADEISKLKGKTLTTEDFKDLSSKMIALSVLESRTLEPLLSNFRETSEKSGFAVDNLIELQQGEYAVSPLVLEVINRAGIEVSTVFEIKGLNFVLEVSESRKNAIRANLGKIGFQNQFIDSVIGVIKKGNRIISTNAGSDTYYHERVHNIYSSGAYNVRIMETVLFNGAEHLFGGKAGKFFSNSRYEKSQNYEEFLADYVAYKISGKGRILKYLTKQEIELLETLPEVKEWIDLAEFKEFINAVRGDLSPSEVEARMKASLVGTDTIRPTVAVETTVPESRVLEDPLTFENKETLELQTAVREAAIAEGLTTQQADSIITILTDPIFRESLVHDSRSPLSIIQFAISYSTPESAESVRRIFENVYVFGREDSLLDRFGDAYRAASEGREIQEFTSLFRELYDAIKDFDLSSIEFEITDPKRANLVRGAKNNANRFVAYIENIVGIERTVSEWTTRYENSFSRFTIDPEAENVVTQARLTQILQNFIINSERILKEKFEKENGRSPEEGELGLILNLDVMVVNGELVLVYQDNAGGVDATAIRDSTIRRIENGELSVEDIARIEIELAVLFEAEGRSLTEAELANLPGLLRSLDLSKPETQDAVAQFILLQGVSTRRFGGGTGLAGVASGLDQIGGDMRVKQRRDSQGNVRGVEIEVKAPTEAAELVIPLENLNGNINKDFGTAEHSSFTEQVDPSGKGGDLSFSFKLKDGTIRTIHLDAINHGETAAQTLDVIRNAIRENSEFSLPELLKSIEAELSIQKGEGILPTDALSVYTITDTLENGEVKYVRSGQQAIIIDIVSGRSEILEATSLPLGVGVREVSLQTIDGRGKVIIVLSDGFFEARDNEGNLVGESVLRTLIEESVREATGRTAKEIKETFLEKWEALKETGIDVTDDLSIVVLRPGRYEPRTEAEIKASEVSERIMNAPHLKDVILGELVVNGDYKNALEVMRVLARSGVVGRSEISELLQLTDGKTVKTEAVMNFYRSRSSDEGENVLTLYINGKGEPILVDNVFTESSIVEGGIFSFFGTRRFRTEQLTIDEIESFFDIEVVLDGKGEPVHIPLEVTGGRTASLDQEITVVISRGGSVKGTYFGRLEPSEIKGYSPTDQVVYGRGLDVKGIGTDIGERLGGNFPEDGVLRPENIEVEPGKLVETLRELAQSEDWNVPENWAEDAAERMSRAIENEQISLPNHPLPIDTGFSRNINSEGKETYTLYIHKKVRELIVTEHTFENFKNIIAGLEMDPVDRAELWESVLAGSEKVIVDGVEKYRITGVENIWWFFKEYDGLSMMWGWGHHTSSIWVGMSNEGTAELSTQRLLARNGFKFLSVIAGDQMIFVNDGTYNIGQLPRILIGEPERVMMVARARKLLARGQRDRAIELLKEAAPENWKEDYMEDFFKNAGSNLRAMLLVDRGNMLGGYPEKDSNWRFEITDMPELKPYPEGREAEHRQFMVKRFFEILNMMNVGFENGRLLVEGENLRNFLGILFDGNTARVESTLDDIRTAYETATVEGRIQTNIFLGGSGEFIYDNWVEHINSRSRSRMDATVVNLLKRTNMLPDELSGLPVEDIVSRIDMRPYLDDLVKQGLVRREHLETYDNLETNLEKSVLETTRKINIFSKEIKKVGGVSLETESIRSTEQNVILALDIPEEQWLSPRVAEIAEALRLSDQSVLVKGEIPTELQRLIDTGLITEEQAIELVRSAPLIFGGLPKTELDRLVDQKRQQQNELKQEAIDFIYSASTRIEFSGDSGKVFITRERWNEFFDKHVERRSYQDKTKLPEEFVNRPITVLTNVILSAASQKGREVFIGGEIQREIVVIRQLGRYLVKWFIRTSNGEIVEVFPVEVSIRSP